MPSWTTLYRAVVMIAAGVIVVKGWQQYGPSAEQARAFAMNAIEKAQAAWNESATEAKPTTAANLDPRTVVPLTEPSSSPSSTSIEPAPKLVPLLNAGEDTLLSTGEATVAAPSEFGNDLANGGAAELLDRLKQLGGADVKVAEWGSGGELYRCSCRATSDGSPLARHFEAVADEPTAAVAQVVAKVEAWRTQQQHLRR